MPLALRGLLEAASNLKEAESELAGAKHWQLLHWHSGIVKVLGFT
jgi:hypothetical protein